MCQKPISLQCCSLNIALRDFYVAILLMGDFVSTYHSGISNVTNLRFVQRDCKFVAQFIGCLLYALHNTASIKSSGSCASLHCDNYSKINLIKYKSPFFPAHFAPHENKQRCELLDSIAHVTSTAEFFFTLETLSPLRRVSGSILVFVSVTCFVYTELRHFEVSPIRPSSNANLIPRGTSLNTINKYTRQLVAIISPLPRKPVLSACRHHLLFALTSQKGRIYSLNAGNRSNRSRFP